MGLGNGLLRGLAPVNVGRIDVGGDYQKVGFQLLGQQCRAQVLVDDRFDAFELAVFIVHGGDATAAGANHDAALFQQPLDRADFEDALGFGAGHHTAVFVAVGLDHPAFFLGQALGFFLAVDRADELGRVFEGRVVGVHFDLGEQGGERHFERQQVAQLLFDHVADHAFGLGAEHVQRVGFVRLV
ncbi:hypothetical protein D3C81_1626390 [compost metagenome]